MIVEMSRVRVLGPAKDRAAVVCALQDFERVQLTTPHPDLTRAEPDRNQEREAFALRRALEDVEAALAALGPKPEITKLVSTATDIACSARLARRTRRALDRIDERIAAAEDERALLLKYRALFATFAPIFARQDAWPGVTAYHVLLERAGRDAVDRLRDALTAIAGDAFELRVQRLPSGESAVLILLPRSRGEDVDRAFADARVREIPVPAAYGGDTLAAAIPRMVARLTAIPAELRAAEDERARLRELHGEELLRARAAIIDRLSALDAVQVTALTKHAFVIEGWVPVAARAELERHLRAAVHASIAVEVIPREAWGDEEPPVALHNPRMLRPFEALLRPLELPRYGNLDPTPLLAVFFPIFFGFMLGDIGYGALLFAVGFSLHRRARPESLRRAVSTIACVCAATAIGFGVMFGELFGDLGHQWLGLRPLLFHRGEQVETVLYIALAIGLVHVVLGVIIGAANAMHRDRRHGIARAISAAMVLLASALVLALAGVLPDAITTPALVALIVGGVGLVVTSGLVGAVELISALCNVLSYARLMALGMASVTVALVANHFGSTAGTALGIVAALLLHLVNFVLGVFSPTIHGLRLHYVEFFGKFLESGGARFRPFGHFESTRGTGGSSWNRP